MNQFHQNFHQNKQTKNMKPQQGPIESLTHFQIHRNLHEEQYLKHECIKYFIQ